MRPKPKNGRHIPTREEDGGRERDEQAKADSRGGYIISMCAVARPAASKVV